MSEQRQSEYGIAAGKRDTSHPLRNVYQSGDEAGQRRPDDGSTFEGLNEIKENENG